jgi:mono/diheme cytochrome c family protein
MAYAAVAWWRTVNIGAVQRGYRVAQAHGCFGCHGPGGLAGLEDQGERVGGVPTFANDDLGAYARDEGEIREWILDGVPKRLREDLEALGEDERPLIQMPAWRGILSDSEVDELVAYIKAVGAFDAPHGEAVAAGRAAAARLGCFACHGPEGRGALPNPRSLKGYIPSWDGADFPELARDEREIREWILDGITERFQRNPAARWFTSRQAIKMPAYRGRISQADLDRLVAYILWLRRETE